MHPGNAPFYTITQPTCAFVGVLQGGAAEAASGATYNPCAQSHCHHACSKYSLPAYCSTDEALGVGTRRH